jgi:hypothetical protein
VQLNSLTRSIIIILISIMMGCVTSPPELPPINKQDGEKAESTKN